MVFVWQSYGMTSNEAIAGHSWEACSWANAVELAFRLCERVLEGKAPMFLIAKSHGSWLVYKTMFNICGMATI